MLTPIFGRACWAVEPLANALAAPAARDSLSRETVRRHPAEGDLKPRQILLS